MIKRQFSFDKDTLYDLYITKNMKVEEIAAQCGCSPTLVMTRLTEFGIRKDRTSIVKQIAESRQKFRMSPEEFRDLYLVQGKTMYEIADIAGVSHSNAAKYAGLFGIKKSCREVTEKDKKMREISPLTKELLQQLYIDQDMTMSMIGQMYGHSANGIKKKLMKLGITKRKQYTRIIASREELQRMYLEDGLTHKQIAQKLGCGHSAVSEHLRKHGLLGIKEKTQRIIVIDGYRMVSVSDDLTESRRYIPEHRIVAEQAIGRPLTGEDKVHHINSTRDDNRVENLAVLSPSDHRRAHGYMEKLGAHMYANGIAPEPLVFDQPVFWAGKWVKQIDLLANKPAQQSFTDLFRAAVDAMPGKAETIN